MASQFRRGYLVHHGSRIWASGISTDESAVRFSGLAKKTGEGDQVDPTSWPKENVIWFEKDDVEERRQTEAIEALTEEVRALRAEVAALREPSGRP